MEVVEWEGHVEHAVALDLTVPGVVSDGGMVSMVSAIQSQNKKVL